MSTFIAFLILISLPLILLLYITESPRQRAVRQRRQGWTYQRIAKHLHVSKSTAHRYVNSPA